MSLTKERHTSSVLCHNMAVTLATSLLWLRPWWTSGTHYVRLSIQASPPRN